MSKHESNKHIVHIEMKFLKMRAAVYMPSAHLLQQQQPIAVGHGGLQNIHQ